MSTPRPTPGISEDLCVGAYAAADGAYVWASAAGSAQDDGGDGLAVSAGRVAVTGQFGGFSSTMDFDPGTGTETRTTDGTSDAFVAYYDAATGALATGVVAGGPGAPDVGLALAAAPNPVRDAATIALTLGTPQTATVAVFDALGRRVAVLHEGLLTAGTHEFRLAAGALPAGVYIVRAATAAGTVARPLTVVR